MEITVQDFEIFLNKFIKQLTADSSYANETKRGVSNDIRYLSDFVKNNIKGEREDISEFFRLRVIDFINEARAESTKARRLYSCQMLGKYFVEEKIFGQDPLSGIRMQDISTARSDQTKRFNHLGDVLSDDEIDSLLVQTWNNFTDNFDPVNYLMLSFLISGVKINDLAKMIWGQVVPKNGRVLLSIEQKKIPLSQRIEMENFMDCVLFYRRNDTDKIFPLSKAGLVQRVNMIGNKAGTRNISPKNFRWTCIYDMVQNGFTNESIAEMLGITKGYLDRINWE